MGSVYSKLSIERRILIEVLLRNGARIGKVADAVKCHRTTIWREVGRAKSDGANFYIAHFGQLYSDRARTTAPLQHHARQPSAGPSLREPRDRLLRHLCHASGHPAQRVGQSADALA
jgi:IS30 family transposase